MYVSCALQVKTPIRSQEIRGLVEMGLAFCSIWPRTMEGL